MAYQSMSINDILNRTKDFERNPSDVTAKEFGLSFIAECFICGTEELTRGKLPDGWRKVKKYGYMLCPECAKKLKRKMGL